MKKLGKITMPEWRVAVKEWEASIQKLKDRYGGGSIFCWHYTVRLETEIPSSLQGKVWRGYGYELKYVGKEYFRICVKCGRVKLASPCRD